MKSSALTIKSIIRRMVKNANTPSARARSYVMTKLTVDDFVVTIEQAGHNGYLTVKLILENFKLKLKNAFTANFAERGSENPIDVKAGGRFEPLFYTDMFIDENLNNYHCCPTKLLTVYDIVKAHTDYLALFKRWLNKPAPSKTESVKEEVAK